MVRASAAIQRAMVTFCWLPPDRRCTSPCARVSICSRSMALTTVARSRRMLIGPQLRRRGAEGQRDVLAHRALHQRAPRCGRPAHRRCRRDGVDRVAELHRLAVDLDRCRRTAGSSRPAPRTARPGPGLRAPRRRRPRRRARSKETSLSLVPTRRLRTARRGRAGARRCLLAAVRAATWVLTMRAPSISSTIFSSTPGTMSTTPTVSPSRSTVARSQSAEISTKRCEMKITERPASALAAHHLEHLFGEVGRQGRRHLVEQQHVGLDGQRAGQIEHAQDGQRDVARGVAEVEIGNAEFAHPVRGTARPACRSGEDWTATSRSGISDGSW